MRLEGARAAGNFDPARNRDDAEYVLAHSGDYTPEQVDEAQATIDATECEGHPAGPLDPMGRTVYCDGSCRG